MAKMSDILRRLKQYFTKEAQDRATDKAELNSAIQLRALTTETGNKIDLEIDSQTFKITAKLYDKNNTLISTSNVIDLPLESVVVSGYYDSSTKEVVLTLESGSVIRFSVADLIYGLQSEITANNPLSSDLVSDTGNANKFVTAGEKAQITTNQNDITNIKDGTNIDSFADVESALEDKQDTISDLATIRSGASLGTTAYQKPSTNIPKTDLASDVQVSLGKADTAIQSHQDISGKEDKSNKVSSFQATPDNTHYPTEKLVKDNLDLKANASSIPTALSQLTQDSTHRLVSDTEKATWNGKQDTISDLETIRSGASAGATAVQDSNYVHTDNNYTTAEKNKLAGLSNYDDTEVRGLITTEANRATKQENKALYFNGAFDSANGKTRQTGYKKASELVYGGTSTDYNNKRVLWCYMPSEYIDISVAPMGNIVLNIPKSQQPWDSVEANVWKQWDIGKIAFLFEGNLSENECKARLENIYIQYKLSTSYTDNGIIEGETILPLDSNMAQMIRQDVVEGLSVLDFSIFGNGRKEFTTSGNTMKEFRLEVWNDKNYGSSECIFNIFSSNESKTKTISTSKTYYCRLGYNGNAQDDKTDFISIYLEKGTYTFNGVFTTFELNHIVYKTLMLSKGTNAYPPSDYHARKHTTDEEATLLKQEEEKCSNLLPNSENRTSRNTTIYFKVNLKAGVTYTFSVQGGTNSGGYDIWGVKNNVQTEIFGNTKAITSKNTFTPTQDCDTLGFYPNDINNANIMLNKGSQAQPYHDWCGEIVHEADIATLLWTNPSPNSDFASQTIDVDMTNYKYIIIEYKRISASSWQETALKKLGVAVVPSSASLPIGFCLFELDIAGDIYYRPIAFDSFTRLAILDAKYKPDNSTANDWLIPVRIYGTNIP